ncbi:DUF2335 domain-containing protein [Galactobacter valiniphilus]|uniref:DUF2335 domain-containing protein n=2 Tax=Galactobacter valiniphilus TaxID=2676122 RepID=A0A399JD05_9MICC|nr:DUF2335 domain-containing protein [Galactobacter valiniphilus]
MRHEGPLPAPHTLAGYGHIDSSFPERIMRMAETQVEANVSATKKLSTADALSTTIGAVTVPLVNIACVVLAGIGVVNGQPQALVAMVVPAGSALIAMVQRTRAGKSPDND